VALSFAIGGILGFGILLLRRHIPESPRWLWLRPEAASTIANIEKRVVDTTGATLDEPKQTLQIHPRRSFGFELIARAMLGKYRVRGAVALMLMIAQAFLFNAVFFSYGLVLSSFYGVPETRTGTHFAAISNQ
jgi:uncharacterized PurR-regulated membrane protein YhhQ (DUF165 family)